jgi:hypothetical protein
VINQELKKKRNILLCLHDALFGEITPNIRAIFVGWNDERISLYFIYSGEISENDIEEASCIETEFSCSLSGPWATALFSTECIRIDAPTPIPNLGKECVYKRKENL